MIHKMEFLNPVFDSGLGVTVRRGPKWYERARVGDSIKAYRTRLVEGCVPLVTAKVVGIAYIPFLLIPDLYLTYEHDPACTNMRGLHRAMREAYLDFKETEMVTVVLFEI